MEPQRPKPCADELQLAHMIRRGAITEAEVNEEVRPATSRRPGPTVLAPHDLDLARQLSVLQLLKTMRHRGHAVVLNRLARAIDARCDARNAER